MSVKILSCVFAITALANSSETRTDLRIVGGRIAQRGEFPYQVALKRSYDVNFFFCGGSIITPRHILTAAHCMFYMWGGLLPPFMVTVVGGQVGLETTPSSITRNASKISVHPEYDSDTMANDIAVVELGEDLPVGGGVIDIIPLNNETTDEDLKCTITGWGVEAYDSEKTSDNLLATEVYTLNFTECQERYDKDDVQLFEGMLCATDHENNSDACQGDSGGPLVCNGRLVGVISTGNGCGNTRFPGIYTDVRHFIPWIEEMTKEDFRSAVNATYRTLSVTTMDKTPIKTTQLLTTDTEDLRSTINATYRTLSVTQTSETPIMTTHFLTTADTFLENLTTEFRKIQTSDDETNDTQTTESSIGWKSTTEYRLSVSPNMNMSHSSAENVSHKNGHFLLIVVLTMFLF